jgi:serine protease Do
VNRDRWPIALLATAALCASAPARAEDPECTRYVPQIGRTVRVPCAADAPAPDPATPPEAIEAVPPSTSPPPSTVLGLTLLPLSEGLKDKYNIGDTIGGIFISKVDERSDAAGRGIKPGDVIMQTNQDVVKSPEDLARNIESVRSSGRKSILLLLRHLDGNLQFVALPVG